MVLLLSSSKTRRREATSAAGYWSNWTILPKSRLDHLQVSAALAPGLPCCLVWLYTAVLLLCALVCPEEDPRFLDAAVKDLASEVVNFPPPVCDIRPALSKHVRVVVRIICSAIGAHPADISNNEQLKGDVISATKRPKEFERPKKFARPSLIKSDVTKERSPVVVWMKHSLRLLKDVS
ncbi:hypothetical protein RRG08_034987 [Elysia crispata]|uniref:Uncharacterized protein n=1 Tax=Elysia crispata TaxID=231223 RepID=A0AAE0Y252_9GAST|nr:hypothetical protein RRG08_034987 [Elysia crispata]